jgi:hypothetical protein
MSRLLIATVPTLTLPRNEAGGTGGGGFDKSDEAFDANA